MVGTGAVPYAPGPHPSSVEFTAVCFGGNALLHVDDFARVDEVGVRGHQRTSRVCIMPGAAEQLVAVGVEPLCDDVHGVAGLLAHVPSDTHTLGDRGKGRNMAVHHCNEDPISDCQIGTKCPVLHAK
jgi:hypothetical protein